MKRRGFTLIELLVVISIIALLMAILIPVVAMAKDLAKTVVCRQNVRSIVTAWYMYADDNDGRLVHADIYTYRDDEWAHNTRNGTIETRSFDEKLEAIKTGRLYDYLKNVKVYHCPADHRYKKVYGPFGDGEYRSYAILRSMNGLTAQEERENEIPVYTKYLQIKRPADFYVIVEEQYKRPSNQQAWHIDSQDHWCCNIAMWHYTKGIFGFADGHAEIHKWQDKNTITYFQSPTMLDTDAQQPNNPDLKWMWEHYPSH